MDHAGLAQVAQQILDDRLAGDADFPDAAVERASGTPNQTARNSRILARDT
jgi:hypothetical protein